MNADEAALAEVAAIVDRGGDADDVLRGVLAALQHAGIAYAALRFVERGALVDGPSIGDEQPAAKVDVTYEGEKVGELAVAAERTFAERVAAQIAPFVLVGWDTGGEPWV